MHLLVLSAFRHYNLEISQIYNKSLNAPFGAQCFPTHRPLDHKSGALVVSMHLLVLSAFRRVDQRDGEYVA